jgi:hypothetical protein
MSTWLIGSISIIYLIVGINFLIKNQYGLGITFIGFFLGNLGLCMEALKQ